MKAVLVGTVHGDKKLYYVIDATSPDVDGVINDGETAKVVNFWKTAVKMNGLSTIKSTDFHKYLWDRTSREEDDDDRWKRIFVTKSQKMPEYLLSGLTLTTDALKSNIKSKSINSRVSEFKTLRQTQNYAIIRNKFGKQIQAIQGEHNDYMG